MCGIAGVFSLQADKPLSPDLVRTMCDLMIHRGPDSEGYFSDKQIAMGMRRLSIIDVSGGQQPISNEDQTVYLVCNGEIYNHLALRKQLESRGHVFRTHSDVEVILHLYEEHGRHCVDHLRGMFAFAIWDKRRERLTLARDRLGKKPIYYRTADGTLTFASELNAIVYGAGARPPVNLRALSDYLSLQYVPAPETIFTGISKMPAAHVLEVQRDSEPKLQRYWRADYRTKTTLPYYEAIDRLEELLVESVRLRLMSEVPLGVFLSSGVDSSLVAAIMTEQSPTRVRSFSIGFDDALFNEAPMAEETAALLGTEHSTFHLSSDLLAHLPNVIHAFGEPFADSSALPTHLLCKEVSQYVTVALTGDGGDEAFAGYTRYALNRLARTLNRTCPTVGASAMRFLLNLLPDPGNDRHSVTVLKRLFEWLKLPPDRQNVKRHMFFDDDTKDQILAPEVREMLRKDRSAEALSLSWYEEILAHHHLDRDLAHDLDHYLPDDILVKADIMSMANSIELRSPILDHEVIEFAASLPASWKIKGVKTGKYCLRAVAKRHLPRTILDRRKKGFSLPIAEWFRDKRRDFLGHILLDPKTIERGIFDRTAVERMISDHVTRRNDHSKRLWALVVLELWFRSSTETDQPALRSAA